MEIEFYNGTTCTADSMIEMLDAQNMWEECFPNKTEDDLEKMMLNHTTFMEMVKVSKLDLRQFMSNAILIWPNIFDRKNLRTIKNNVDKYVP